MRAGRDGGGQPHGLPPMKVTPATDDVFQLALMPRSGVNAYLVGDVIVNAGMPMSAGGIIKALDGRKVATHVLTHAHGDHAGGSKKLSDKLLRAEIALRRQIEAVATRWSGSAS